jgi:hypothetical protein
MVRVKHQAMDRKNLSQDTHVFTRICFLGITIHGHQGLPSLLFGMIYTEITIKIQKELAPIGWQPNIIGHMCNGGDRGRAGQHRQLAINENLSCRVRY